MGISQQKTGLAVVTGASSGIGFELAKIAAFTPSIPSRRSVRWREHETQS
ncbi:hypothetical protein NOJ05_29885 [Neorhizobium galegae]|nr:hypothetical protein [Neorhizobium galegae]MCQ1781414.1 hypothetical protein [Neorhizobium galegae]CDZ30785.1 Hypothetical protein NGAL_HAMBI490_56570 [Neorhizobium galegae bv. officinalis]